MLGYIQIFPIFWWAPNHRKRSSTQSIPSIRSLYPTAHYATMHRISTSSSGCVNNHTDSTAFKGDFESCPCMTQWAPPKNRGKPLPTGRWTHTAHSAVGKRADPTHWRGGNFANSANQTHTSVGQVDRISCWISCHNCHTEKTLQGLTLQRTSSKKKIESSRETALTKTFYVLWMWEGNLPISQNRAECVVDS